MKRIAWYLAFAWITASMALAQNAQLSGVVKDKTGAVVPLAEVTLKNLDTAGTLQTKTSKVGFFVFPSVQPGKYDLSATAKGFDVTVVNGIKVDTAANVSQDLILQIKQGAETVTVVQREELNTTDGTVSTVIEHEFIDNMPLNGKDLTTLFELTPGTLLNAGGAPSNGGGFSVDGQRPTANYVTVDGASAEAYVPIASSSFSNNTGAGIATSASGSTNGILPVDAIEEYRMDTATYTAENGRTPGGQIQVRTRSGTNQFHGTLFESFRNQIFDADDWFTKYDDLTQAQLRMNEFGGTLGGPILPNKIFFFVANDNLVLDQPNTNSRSYVPDPSLIVGAFPVFKTWLSVFPLGNGGQVPNVPGWDYFSASYPDLVRDHTTSLRLDWQLPKAIRAFFRINVAPSSSVVPSQSGEASDGNGGYVSVNTYTWGLTAPIGTRIVNDLTVNYTSDSTKGLNFVSSIGQNTPSALQNNLPTGVNAALDNFTFGPSDSNYSASDEATVGPTSRNALHQWNIVDTLALHKGKNTLKFGVDVLTRQSIIRNNRNTYFVEVLGGLVPPYTTTDLDTGTISYLESEENIANPLVSLSNSSLFANEDWKATSSLTLNVGLRWEFNPPPTVGPLGAIAVVGDNLNPSTFVDALSTKPLYQAIYSNCAPRLGFAWTPFPKSKSVVRGGAGIYFDTGQASSVAGTSAGQGYPYLYAASFNEIPYSSIDWGSIGAAVSGPTSPLSLVDPHLLSPRTYEWSLTFDQNMGRSTKLTTSYVGNDGEKLIGQNLYYNYPNSLGEYPVNTTYVRKYGNLRIATNQSHSNYQALQLQLSSKMGQRFSALVSYTWEHAEDNGSSDFSSVGGLALNKIANSANDVPQIFASALHYAPHGFNGSRWVRAFTGGWGVDTIVRTQSALPITVIYSGNYNNPNSFTTNADVVPGVPAVLHEHVNSSGVVVPGNRMLNWAAFTAPPVDSSGNQLRNGDSPTNGYRLFALKQWDLATSRTWTLWRGLNLNFRVDAFNVLNAVNFGSVLNSWNASNASTFGLSQATYASSNGSSVGQTSDGQQLATFQNGGPRELQLSLKFKF